MNSGNLINCDARVATTEFQGRRLKIAIVICTYRRPDSLARALTSIAEAAAPLAAEWQVLVVDNADCAGTRRVADGFRSRLPIDILVEPAAGLARARNAAIRQLDCDYVIWTDDDVAVAPHWLRSYEAAFAANPDAAFFGGPILPQFEGRPPAWLTASLPLVHTAFAGRDLAGEVAAGRLQPGQLPYGANMAIRAREQHALRYDVTLGRQPGPWLLSGEESALLNRICGAGGFGIWVTEARVTHWIDAERQTVAYLRRYYEGRAFAQARAALARQAEVDTASLAVWRDLLWSELAYLRGWLSGRPKLWVTALKEASRLRGMLAARREFRRQGGLGLEAEG